jgi:hypothetical protein
MTHCTQTRLPRGGSRIREFANPLAEPDNKPVCVTTPQIASWLTAAAILACLMSVSSEARAQSPGSVKEPLSEAESQDATPKGVRTREWIQKGAQKVIEITFDEENADRIYGKVQKPGVDYLITQGDLEYEGIPLDVDLMKALRESVRGPGF